MDLKTFVAETLSQIADGIQEAQKRNTNTWICPPTGAKPSDAKTLLGYRDAVEEVVFDVAITAVESDAQKGGGGLKVLSFSLGAGVESSSQNSTVSRVQFSIPVFWPRTEMPDDVFPRPQSSGATFGNAGSR